LSEQKEQNADIKKTESYMIRSAINYFRENLKRNYKECEKQIEEDLLRK